MSVRTGAGRAHHLRGRCAGRGSPRVPRPRQSHQSRPGPASLCLLGASSPKVPVKEEHLP
uniref:Uncharacterized protein n=1 Tax=Balaenoptera musculus TaxID=9771 RepID=A0A8C0CBQ0_BALMU